MYKMVVTLLTVFLLFSLAGQKVAAENKIFVIDTSGSMRKGGLFENIKRELKQIIDEEEIGNHVLILTFDENVGIEANKRIETEEDHDNIKNIIDRLTATGPWTWMTKAFDRTVDEAEVLKKAYPKDRLTIYLLTDGRNDPPPRVKEPPLKFIEVLINYFKDFEIRDTYIYLLSYRPLEDEERGRVEDETPVVIVEPPVQEPIPRIELKFSNFEFGEVDLSQERKTVSGWITVDKLPDAAKGREISLTPTPQYIEVAPKIIQCKQEGQKEKISITLPAGLSSGEHTGSIRLDAPTTVIEPPELVFSFFVPVIEEPEPVDGDGRIWLFLAILLVLIAVLCVLYFGHLRIKTVWAKREGDDEPKESEIRGWREIYHGEREKESFVSFELPNYYLMTKKRRTAIILGDEMG